jgi:hypothetical protein
MVLKERLVLAFNFFKPIAKWAYKLYISWSSLGIGAVLMQMANEGKKFIIARKRVFSSNMGNFSLLILYLWK